MLAKTLYVLLVIPHNPIWIGSKSDISRHPALYRKLRLLVNINLFKYILVIEGGNNNAVLQHKDIYPQNVYVIQLRYRNLLFFSIRAIVLVCSLILRLLLRRIVVFLLFFDHVHLYSSILKLLSKFLFCHIMSFYVNTPRTLKEKLQYFISKQCDELSLTNHVLLARELRLPSNKLIIIPNFPEEIYKRQYQVKSLPKKPLIIYVGRLSNEKTPHYAIYIFYKLCKYYTKPLKMLVVGDGPLRIPLEHMVKSLTTFKDNIAFLGYRRFHEVQELMSRAYALIHVSPYEYFPNTIVEAIAHRTLVLAADLPQYRWILDGTCLIDFTNLDRSVRRIAVILDNHALYEKLLNIQMTRLKELKKLYELGKNMLYREVLKRVKKLETSIS